jgi:DNA-binding transcriptional LysR family regulator
MDRFQEMQVFLAVAEEQGFARAARRLSLSPASVTRAVAALEERIGTLLLARTTRNVRMTEAGQRYVEDCRRILAELQEAEESAAGSHAIARGQLTLTAPVLFGELYVTPLLVSYLEQQPAVQIKALLIDRVVSMVDEGIDVAIRIGPLPDSGLYAVPVGSVRRVLCAAPAYLAKYGRPQHPLALTEQRIVMSNSNSGAVDWQFTDVTGPLSVRPQPQLLVTTNQAAIAAAQLGWGLTRVLSYQVAAQVAARQLELLLESFEPPPLPIHVVYQGGRKVPAKVRTLVDFCVEQLRQNPALNPH